MNKWPAGPAQSKKSSKRVLSFIYLFKSRRSAGAYLFIQNQTVFRPSFFHFFIFLILLERGNRSFIYSKTSRFSGPHFFIFLIQTWQKILIPSFRMRRLGGPCLRNPQGNESDTCQIYQNCHVVPEKSTTFIDSSLCGHKT